MGDGTLMVASVLRVRQVPYYAHLAEVPPLRTADLWYFMSVDSRGEVLGQVALGLEAALAQGTLDRPLFPGPVRKKVLGQRGHGGQTLSTLGTVGTLVLVVTSLHVDLEGALLLEDGGAVLHKTGEFSGRLKLESFHGVPLRPATDGDVRGVGVASDPSGCSFLFLCLFHPLLRHPLASVDDHSLSWRLRKGCGNNRATFKRKRGTIEERQRMTERRKRAIEKRKRTSDSRKGLLLLQLPDGT